MFSKALVTSLVAAGALAAAAPAIACDGATPTLTPPTPMHAGVSDPSVVSPGVVFTDQPDLSLVSPGAISPDEPISPTPGNGDQQDPPRMPPGATPPTPCGP